MAILEGFMIPAKKGGPLHIHPGVSSEYMPIGGRP